MKFINPKKSTKAKQGDKLEIKIRFGKVTILEISMDTSTKKFRFEIFNMAIEL